MKYEIEPVEPEAAGVGEWGDCEGDDLVRFITDQIVNSAPDKQSENLTSKKLILGLLKEHYNGIHVLLTIESNREMDVQEIDYYIGVITQYMQPIDRGIDIGFQISRISRIAGGKAFLLEFNVKEFASYGEIIFGLASTIDKKMFPGLRVDFSYKSFLGLDRQPIICSDDGSIAYLIAQEFSFSQ
jgi:hypothetical protein